MAFGLLVVVNIAGNFAGDNILQKHESKHRRTIRETSGDFVSTHLWQVFGLWTLPPLIL